MAEFQKIFKANPNHDSHGRFTGKGKGSGYGGAAPAGDGSNKTKDAPTDTDLNNQGFREGNHLAAIDKSLKKKGFEKVDDLQTHSGITRIYEHKTTPLRTTVKFMSNANETEWNPSY